MSPQAPVRLLGLALMASVVVMGGVGLALPRLVGPLGGTAVLAVLTYLSAAALLGLALTGPGLATRLGSNGREAQGVIVAMALAEGMAMAGIMAAGLAAQPLWVLALTATGLIVILRIQSTAT